jgi:hypothetical protein
MWQEFTHSRKRLDDSQNFMGMPQIPGVDRYHETIPSIFTFRYLFGKRFDSSNRLGVGYMNRGRGISREGRGGRSRGEGDLEGRWEEG